MERWEVKLIALVGLLVIPLVCTILPVKVSNYFNRKGEKGKRVLSCLMCFGGGVFFAVFMLHMAPEARGIVYNAIEKPYQVHYPVADLLMSAGFFIVMFMEMAVMAWSKQQPRRRSLQASQDSKSPGDTSLFDTKHCTVNGGNTDKLDADIEDGKAGENMRLSIKNHANGVIPHVDTTKSSPLLGNRSAVVVRDDADLDVLTPLSTHAHSHGLPTDGEGLSTRSWVLLLALSLHRIFEGMSVGLQYSILNVWNLFIAIACHESIIGFSLGLQLVKGPLSVRRVLLAAGVCSLFEPVGVAIGTVIVETGEATPTLDIVNGILQSIATGTFIYITFFEILQEEISPHDASMEKLLSVMIGFIVMAALCAVPEDSAAPSGDVSPYESFVDVITNVTTVRPPV